MSNNQNFWLRAATGIDALNERIGKATSWLTLVLVVLVAVDVVIRYLFSDSKVWITELQWHLFALIFLLGAGYAFRHDRHVRVDLFYSKFNERDKAMVDFAGNLLFLIPWCCIVGWFAFFFALDSFQISETSADAGGLPARYLIKSAIAVGIFLLLLQSIAQVIRAGMILFKVKLEG
mgnify:CR=1 FL=1